MAETRRRVPPSRSLLVESPNSPPGTNSRKWSTKASRAPEFLHAGERQRVGPAAFVFQRSVVGRRSLVVRCPQCLRRFRSWVGSLTTDDSRPTTDDQSCLAESF